MRFKRSSLLTKIILLVLVAYAIVTLVSLQTQTSKKNAEAEVLQAQIETARQENLRIQHSIDTLGTEEGIVDAAHKKLGWASKKEILFYDMGN